ncbi:MAG: PIN domain-containing protein [Candidatus Diapherotrites archaeon]|nr:PIN domain-containing protein [Candidatus Diapherotrites archaeon]
MKVTLHANVLFAALIREGTTRRIWFNPELNLCAPALLVSELTKYSELILRKSGRKQSDFEQLLEHTLEQITLIADQELTPYLPAAATLSNDPKDWLYLACALREDTLLWSNDKEFRKQRRIKVKTTEEMVKEYGTL